MTTIINGSSPSVTFSDNTTQTTAGLPLTGGTITGNVAISGSTSGAITLAANAVAGTNTLTLPAATGTLGMVLISSQTANSSSTIDFTSISNNTYSAYKVIADNIVCSVNGTSILMRVSVGSSFQTGSVYGHRTYRWVAAGAAPSGSNSDTAIYISPSGDTMSNSSTNGNSFELTAFNQAQTNTYKRYVWSFDGLCSDQLTAAGGAYYLSTSNAVDGFRFFMSSGTFVTGTFKLYGIV
jgi:hypothetical protein